jgi:hypothetical protein
MGNPLGLVIIFSAFRKGTPSLESMPVGLMESMLSQRRRQALS